MTTSRYRSKSFGILKGALKCWSCLLPTSVSGIVVWNGEEQFDSDSSWDRVDEAMLFNYLEELNSEALALWQKHCPTVAFASTHTSGKSYYANHCIHCSAVQGDWYLTEPDGPFFPLSQDGVLKLSLIWYEHPIKAVGGHCQASWLDDFIEEAIRSHPQN